MGSKQNHSKWEKEVKEVKVPSLSGTYPPIYSQVGKWKLLRAPGTQAVTYLALYLVGCLNN